MISNLLVQYTKGWRDRVVSSEEIVCTGCSSHKKGTYNLVECIKQHNIEKCNQCTEFPCEKIQDMLARSTEYQENCMQICLKQEYKTLEKAFFHKKVTWENRSMILKQ